MDDTRTLLNLLPVLQHPCDLDLIVFFATHPRSLLSTEQLARLLGYDVCAIARSLNVLLAAGLLAGAHQPTRPARMYVLSTDAMTDGPLPVIVALAATREGRLTLRRVLTDSPAATVGEATTIRHHTSSAHEEHR